MRSKMCDVFATPHSALQRRWKMSDVRCMMSDGRWKMWLCAAFFILYSSLFISCKQEDDRTETVAARHWVEKTVAVVAPIGDAATKARLERTAGWFLQNFREAQMHDTLAIDLKIAWYDELSADLAELSQTLAADSTVVAVIGPFSNEGVAEFAPACMKTQKPLIAPTATSEDVIRRYAVTTSGQKTNTTPFLWSLTETDVNFTGLLMSGFATESKYYEYQYKDILEDDELTDAMCGVFTPDDAYGMTFNYWAPFYAQEVGITLQRNQQFGSSGSSAGLLSLLGEYRPVMRESPFVRSAIFCAVETAQQMYDVVRDNRKALIDDPQLADMLPSTDPDDPANDQFWQLFNATYQTYPDLLRLLGLERGCPGGPRPARHEDTAGHRRLLALRRPRHRLRTELQDALLATAHLRRVQVLRCSHARRLRRLLRRTPPHGGSIACHTLFREKCFTLHSSFFI